MCCHPLICLDCSAQKYVHDTMEETIVAAFPKASFIEVQWGLTDGHHAVMIGSAQSNQVSDP